MENIRIPQKNTQPKKIYKVDIEGDTYTVKGSVLIAKDSTKYYNQLSRLTQNLSENFDTEILEQIYDSAINLYNILLGEKQTNKLLNKIDAKYDVETGQTVLLEYAMSLYIVAQGGNQEAINKIFFREKSTKEK